MDLSEREFRELERRMLEEFQLCASKYPDARLYIVAHSREGFSREFHQEIKKYRVTFRVPIQFFDTAFKVDYARDFKSAISSLLDASDPKRRVLQPFDFETQGQVCEGEGDLLDCLVKEISSNGGTPCLHIIAGSAGAGKSVFFQALFKQLYSQFMEKKRRQQHGGLRPIPLLPQYLSAGSPRTQDLINNFLQRDVATPVSPPTFDWLLVNGFSMWLFDGLDELYAGDKVFFDKLLELLTTPDSKAQILICARDSLLTSSETFSEFIHEFLPGGENVRLYRLKKWETPSKRALAWVKLADRSPRKGEDETPKVQQFLQTLSESTSLRALSGIPYYCDLLLQEFQAGSVEEYQDDVTLLRRAIEGITEREKEKGVLRPDNFEVGGLEEWLECVGCEYYESDFKGIAVEDVREYAGSVIRAELSDDEFQDTVTTLVQFPLFAPGAEPGTIAFKHELVAEYLAGKHLAKIIRRSPGTAAGRIRTRIDLADSLINRFLATEIGADAATFASVENVLGMSSLQERAFVHLLQIFLTAAPGKRLKETNIILEGRNLQHMKFHKLDLAGVSFRNSNLAHCSFVACNLRNAFFESAHLSGTSFKKLEEGALTGARFGPLDRFESIYVSRKRIDELNAMAEWLRQETGVDEEGDEPCPAARQLRVLLGKYVYPTGVGRRDQLPHIALLRGKRVTGAPSSSDCIKAATQGGYLEQPDHKDRVKRASSRDRYAEIVLFMRESQLPDGILRILNSICDRPSCRHLPAQRAGS